VPAGDEGGEGYCLAKPGGAGPALHRPGRWSPPAVLSSTTEAVAAERAHGGVAVQGVTAVIFVTCSLPATSLLTEVRLE